MHIHIAGICGTFMGGLAIIAKRLGFDVSGSDSNVYPPMSTQLEEHGIQLFEGYEARYLEPAPDLVIIGNALSRGNPIVEAVLERGIPYTSGPQWLSEHVLQNSWVVAVAGTHGKTTTASMVAWILQYNGLHPSFLIGGIPLDFGVSAKVSESPFFVIEADEYDTAFFDKRSKFVHYHPRTTVINNLEYDHADIFPDLEAIQLQFHHLLRIVPNNGLIIKPEVDKHVDAVIDRGCWSPVQSFGIDGKFSVSNQAVDYSSFEVVIDEQVAGRVEWSLLGEHNCKNALAAIAAARHCGVKPAQAVEALCEFSGVKRRLERVASIHSVHVYDDFAHHPTAIQSTLESVRRNIKKNERVFAVFEPRSNTMKMGVHKDRIHNALLAADRLFAFKSDDMDWSLEESLQRAVALQAVVGEDSEGAEARWCCKGSVPELASAIVEQARPGDHIVIMSNGSFEGIHQLVIEQLQNKFPDSSL